MNTITLYGKDAAILVDLIHKYRLWEPPQEPAPWGEDKIARIAKRLTVKQVEAVLMLDGITKRGYRTVRKTSHVGTWTTDEIGATPIPMIYINGRVYNELDAWGIVRHWITDNQTALTQNGIAILEYLKENA